MVAIVHCWVDGNFLSDREAIDVDSNLVNSATELVPKSDRKFCTSMRIFGSLGRYEYRASQVFVEVGAADSAIRHLEPDFVPTTFTGLMSVDAVIVNSDKSCLLQATHGMGIVSRRMSPLAWNRIACMVAMINTHGTVGQHQLGS